MALTRLGLNQSINLASNVTGTLATGNGGTGATSFSPGKVLQVVNTLFNTQTDSSSTSYADTGMSRTITCSATSSKVLILVSHGGLLKETNDEAGKIQLGRTIGGSYTALAMFENDYGRNGASTLNAVGGASTCYLDSPSSTAEITYKTRFANSVSADALVRISQNNATATITCMEIGA
tara:strand:- start:328 stop:864 length:537 start_codon:yes stop_codon:yes gene_type:complete